jgi:phosphatidylglycerol:prolipoprotein diacylglycerol transferase
VDVPGRLQPADRFLQDEIIEEVVPGSGPISVTARVRDINPGEWVVTAQMQGSASLTPGQHRQENVTLATHPVRPIARLWRRWAPSAEETEHMRTCLAPFAHVPGILPGIWGTMVTLGMVSALVLQSLIISAGHLALGPWWVISLSAITVGIAGAKGWYLFLYRRERLRNGWCIQGFIIGASLAAAILLVVIGIPVGVFLDATAPGLLLAMAVGRVGCFFAGCCGGPPTASRFGVWSSDQRVGARRIPTQLMESGLAGILGLGTLVAVLRHGPSGSAFFVAGLAAYTLARQGILHVRAERRKTRLGLPVTIALAALMLVTSVVFLVR